MKRMKAMKRFWEGSLSSSIHRWSIIFLLFATTLLAGCGTAPEAAGTPTRTPRPTRTSFPPSYTPTATWTPKPIDLATQAAQTATVDAWLEAHQATNSAAATILAPFPGECHLNPFIVSPDGNWLAGNCFSEFQVVRRDDSAMIIITSQELYADLANRIEWGCMGGAYPLHWTRDNRYLYFSRDAGCLEPGGLPTLGYPHGPLYRLDSQTGEWTDMVRGSGNPVSFFFYSFSPTDRRLAYAGLYRQQALPSLYILDLTTGELISVTIREFYEIGGMVWAPDGLSFAFVILTIGEDFSDESARYSVFIYNIAAHSMSEIIAGVPERRIPQEWTSENIVVIPLIEPGYSYGIIPGHTIYYDVGVRSFFTPAP